MSVIGVEEDTLVSAAAGRDPLDVTAAKIKACLVRADNQRITAGQLLIEARERVTAGEAGNIGWQAWCLANIDRSYHNLQRLIAVAKADDPQAALERGRAAARERMRRSREALNSSAKAADALEAFDANRLVRVALGAYRALNKTQRLEFQRETKLRPVSKFRDMEGAYQRLNVSTEAARSRAKAAERERDELLAALAKVATPLAPARAPKPAPSKRGKPMRSRLQQLIATSWGSQFPEMRLPVTAVRGQDPAMV